MRGAFLPVIVAGLTPLVVLTILSLSVGFSWVQWQPPTLWTTQFGTQSESDVVALSGNSQGLFAAGFLNGGPRGLPSTHLVAGLDFNGHVEWQSLGKNGSDFPVVNELSSGSEGVYVAWQSAVFSGLVEKYYLNGSLAWSTPFMTDATGISTDANSVYVVGYLFSNGQTYSYFLRRYDFSGNIVSTSFLSNSTILQNVSVFSDSSGVYVSGVNGTDGQVSYFLRRYDLDGILKWSANCTCYRSGVSADSTGIYVTGMGAFGTGALSRYDLNGKQVWTRMIPSPDPTDVADIHLSTDSSGVDLAMKTSMFGYLMRYDGGGNQLWSIRTLQSLDSVWAGQSGVYVGGKDTFAELTIGNGFVSEYSTSSSLILFWVNPPWSFAILAGVGGAVVLSVVWYGRRLRRRALRPKTSVPRPSSRSPEDHRQWIKRGP